MACNVGIFSGARWEILNVVPRDTGSLLCRLAYDHGILPATLCVTGLSVIDDMLVDVKFSAGGTEGQRSAQVSAFLEVLVSVYKALDVTKTKIMKVG